MQSTVIYLGKVQQSTVIYEVLNMPKEGFDTVTIKTETLKKVSEYVKDCKEKGIKTSKAKVVTQAVNEFIDKEGN